MACDNGKGCGAGLFAKLIQRKSVTLKLPRNEIDVQAGQMLTLAFPGQMYMKLVLATYGWPLVAAIGGAVTGHSLTAWAGFHPALIDAVTFAGGVLAAWLAMRVFRSRDSEKTILSSLNMTVCIPSNTPNMCTEMVAKPEKG